MTLRRALLLAAAVWTIFVLPSMVALDWHAFASVAGAWLTAVLLLTATTSVRP